MAVSMVTTIKNYSELFCYGVKRDKCERIIGIIELLEQLVPDCFNNTFTTDTGTPKKTLID